MSLVDIGITRDGYTQLRRRWPADRPRAVVLLVHGLSEHSGRYEHVGAAFADAGFHMVAFDLRGHGQSGGIRTHVDDFDEFLDDVEDHLAEVRSVGLPVVLFGHSMGGLIAARYAVSGRPQPDLLILSAPALGSSMPAVARPVTRLIGGTAPTVRVKSPFGADALSRDLEVQRAYVDDPLVFRNMTVGMGAEMLKAMEYLNAHLDELTLPTLVVHGGEDRLVPRSASEPLEPLEPVSRTVYEGLRHEILNEPEWELVVGDIEAWVNKRLDPN